MNETKLLAAWTAGLTYEVLSSQTVRKTKQCILDWLGVSIGGSQEKPVKILRRVLQPSGESEATLLCGGFKKVAALQAAFCNGAASHTLDFDDLHNPSIIHLATVVVPPVFAIGEKEHSSGREMLAGVVAGYEVGARVGEAIIPESYHFWHTTGTAGVIGGGAGAARTLGLTAEQTLMCLGSTGTQTAGLWEFLSEGAMSKPLHTGKGCYTAVLSAYLAKEGFTGASRILEGEKGFCLALTPQAHLEKLTGGLAERQGPEGPFDYAGYHYKIDDNSFKPYPCCKHSHAAIYGAEALKAQYHLEAGDIVGGELLVNSITDSLINNPEPKTVYGCKFSVQYCVACMLVFGKVEVKSFTPEAMQDAVIRDLMKRIKVRQDPEVQAIYDGNPDKLASRLVLHLKDGSRVEQLVEYPKGDPQNPMSWEESVAKFTSLVEPVYGSKVAGQLVTLVDTLEQQEDFAVGLSRALKA